MKRKGIAAKTKTVLCLLISAVMVFSHISPVLADDGENQPTSTYSSIEECFIVNGVKPADYD